MRNHLSELLIDAEGEARLVALALQTGRDVEFVQEYQAALRGGKPCQDFTRNRPGEDSLAVREQQRFDFKIAAYREQSGTDDITC